MSVVIVKLCFSSSILVETILLCCQKVGNNNMLTLSDRLTQAAMRRSKISSQLNRDEVSVGSYVTFQSNVEVPVDPLLMAAGDDIDVLNNAMHTELHSLQAGGGDDSGGGSCFKKKIGVMSAK